MQGIVWILLLAVAAVVGATALGANDGLVTLFWMGWRVDFSLNLFLLGLLVFILAVYSLVRGLDGLLNLPERARRWRITQRDRLAQAALREGLALYMAGRYTRAHKACQRAIAIQADTPELALDAEFTSLAHLLSAGSLHRLQDRARRDEHLQRAIELSQLTRKPRATEEGARLLAAECALEDRDAGRALRDLAELPPGVARRTQALRLKLQATRLARQPMEALKTARLLAKHQGFTAGAAEGLLRSLASEALESARDVDQLRSVWQQLDAADRRDVFVAARAAQCAAAMGAPEDGRGWLRPFWEALSEQGEDEREALAEALVPCMPGLGPEWLQRLEGALQRFPRDVHMSYALGHALAERQLWGKARLMLEQAAADQGLSMAARRRSWLRLADMAERDGDLERRARCFESAAFLN